MNTLEKIIKRTPVKTKRRVQRNLAIAERIHQLLQQKGMSQKDLAIKMGKQPSEICKWLTGLHNFEIKTIENIELALEEDIIEVTTSVHIQLTKPDNIKIDEPHVWAVAEKEVKYITGKQTPGKRKK